MLLMLAPGIFRRALACRLIHASMAKDTFAGLRPMAARFREFREDRRPGATWSNLL